MSLEKDLLTIINKSKCDDDIHINFIFSANNLTKKYDLSFKELINKYVDLKIQYKK